MMEGPPTATSWNRIRLAAVAAAAAAAAAAAGGGAASDVKETNDARTDVQTTRCPPDLGKIPN